MKYITEDFQLGLFDLTGRDTLIKTAMHISDLQAKIYLAEYLALYNEVRKEHKEYFHELVEKRDLIKLCLKYNLDNELTELKNEWFSNSGSYSSSAGSRDVIERIAHSNQLACDYISNLEGSRFRTDSIDFNDYSFESLKNYCMYTSLLAIPKAHMEVIYKSPKYKSSIEFHNDMSLLHSMWNQINVLLANYNTEP